MLKLDNVVVNYGAIRALGSRRLRDHTTDDTEVSQKHRDALSKSRLAAGPVAVHPAASSPRRTIAVVGSGRAGAPHGATRCPGLRRPGPWCSTEQHRE